MNDLNPSKGELEMSIHYYGKIISSPEHKAKLEYFLRWISEGPTPEDREIRLKFITDYARKMLEKDANEN